MNKLHETREQKPGSRSFLPIFFLFGVLCLTLTQGWHVYMDPLKNGQEWILSKTGFFAPGKAADMQAQHTGTDGKANGAGSSFDTRGGENAGNEGVRSSAGENSPGESDQHPQKDGNEGNGNGSHKDGNREDGNGGDKQDGEDPENDEPEEPAGPTFETVEDDYFADAVFIGDSRIVGLYEYGGLEEVSTFYAATGLSVYKLFTAKIVPIPNSRKKTTVEEALSERQFSKIYLMLGINEMGTGTPETFLAKYAECVQHLRELQPDAIIYLQSIMSVTEARSQKGDYITNEGIQIRNEGIAAMADDEHIFYLDVNEAVCEEDGTMIASYTYDGVHLKAQYIPLWKDYLMSHAVVLTDEAE